MAVAGTTTAGGGRRWSVWRGVARAAGTEKDFRRPASGAPEADSPRGRAGFETGGGVTGRLPPTAVPDWRRYCLQVKDAGVAAGRVSGGECAAALVPLATC